MHWVFPLFSIHECYVSASYKHFPLMGWSLSSSILPCCPVILLSPSFNLLMRLSMGFLFFISNVSVFFSPQVFLSPYWIHFHILHSLSHLIQLLVWVLLELYRLFFFWLLCLEFYLLHFYLEEIAVGIVTSGGVLLPCFFFMFSVFLHLDLCTWGKVVI